MSNSPLLEKLNPPQREAVCYSEGPLLVLAGAGSGKTRVLTHKIAWLVEQGEDPRKIMAVTFTNKAAREMQLRVEKLLPQTSWGVQISTFHSWGVRFLRRHSEALLSLGYASNTTIFDPGDVRSLIKKIMLEKGFEVERGDLRKMAEYLSRIKTSTLPGEEIRALQEGEEALFEIYRAYDREMKRQSALDFDDLLVLPLYLLATSKQILEFERSRLSWVLVDEYQDVNRIQYSLLKRLTGPRRSLMVVGDPDQSIYGWRGADMQMILNFERDFPQAKVIVLDQNYRSTGTILEGANAVIRNNLERKEKNLWTAQGRGEPIHTLLAPSGNYESQFVAREIDNLLAQGFRHKDMAILYRINALSRGIEQALLYRGIPYRVVRGTAFYERLEVKDVLSYLRLSCNPLDIPSLERVANIPSRGLGKKSLESLGSALLAMRNLAPEDAWAEVARDGAKLKGKALKGAREFGEHMRELSLRREHLPEALEYVLQDMGYQEYLLQKEPDNGEERMENVRELLSVSSSEGGVSQFLEEISLFTDLERLNEEDEAVSLLTLHAAKGLEFPVVFLVGMEENLFPNARALEEEGGLEEERRLCYVGMTRAEERLYLCGARGRTLFGSMQLNGFSRFLWEIPENLRRTEDRGKEEEHGFRRSPYRGYRSR